MTTFTNKSKGRTWPEGHEQRQTEYKRRRAAYLGHAYTDAEHKELGLFRATDGAGTVIHETSRISRDGAYVTDVDAAALCNGLALNVDPEAVRGVVVDGPDDPDRAELRQVIADETVRGDLLSQGLDVWYRSMLDEDTQRLATSLCTHGDLHLECVWEPDGSAHVVAHMPEHVELFYDKWGRELERVDIEIEYVEAGEQPEDEAVEHVYRRVLTRDEIRTQIDDGPWDVTSHPLGVVPLLHVRCRPSPHDPCMSLHSAAGLEHATAIYDSAASLTVAIGSRHASPWIVLSGAATGELDISAATKILGLPHHEATIQYLEATLQGVNAFHEMGTGVREHIVDTCPQFVFNDAGADASGAALSYRAGDYKRQIEPVQRRFWRALGKAVGMCRALQLGRPFTGDLDVYAVEGAPALPEDRQAVIDQIATLLDEALILRRDAIARLQAIGAGLPEDADPDAYAEEAMAERTNSDAATLSQARSVIEAMQAGERDAEMEPEEAA